MARKQVRKQLPLSQCPPSPFSMSTPDLRVGLFFHSFYPKERYPDAPAGRVVSWQGQVLAHLNGMFSVQLFSWLDGDTTDVKIVHGEDVRDWKFYQTAEDMNWWYEETYAPRMRGYHWNEAVPAEQGA